MSVVLRIVGRTACLLLLIGAVAGVLYLLIGTGGPPRPQERGRSPDVANESEAPDAAFHGGHFDRGRGRGSEGGLPGHGGRRSLEEASVGHGVAGMLGTAIQIGVVGAAVVGVQRLSRRRRLVSP
jgi:hypothetical protein